MISDTLKIVDLIEFREINSRDKERSVVVFNPKKEIVFHDDNVKGMIKTPKTNAIKAGTKLEIDNYIKDNKLKVIDEEAVIGI